VTFESAENSSWCRAQRAEDPFLFVAEQLNAGLIEERDEVTYDLR
jgi:hypothetical protein